MRRQGRRPAPPRRRAAAGRRPPPEAGPRGAGRRRGPEARHLLARDSGRPAWRARGLAALREELAERLREPPARWNADAQDVQRSVARLVLTLVEFLRALFERQALRRLEAGTLTPDQTEALGLALMRLEETIRDLARRFDLSPEELTLDLGPLGRLK